MQPRHHHRPGARDVLARACSLTLVALLGSATLCLQAQPTPATPATGTSPELGADEPIEMMEYVTQARGVSRATNSITPQDAEVALPGTSVDTMLASIPGVTVTTRDPFGFYEFGNSIQVRSFGISAVGVTIDDIPMGNNSARYGLPTGRVTDQENIASITVSPGTGDLTIPAYEALGGSVKYYTSDPALAPSARVKISTGSFDMNRYYVRYDTGEIAPGLTAWVSGSQLKFKTAGIPEYSEGWKIESKVKFEKENFTGWLAYTYNYRDDWDTTTVRIDRLKALQSGDPYGLYPEELYDAQNLGSQKAVLETYAENGFANYIELLGNGYTNDAYADLTDEGRVLAFPTVLDATQNPGDGLNARYYRWGKNGRKDHFLRGKAGVKLGDVDLTALGYYQDRDYYGTATVARSDVITQIRSAYRLGGEDGGIMTTVRDDIWPQFLFVDGTDLTTVVPYGTEGAVPVRFTDANGNNIWDLGETLTPDSSITPASIFASSGAAKVALVAPGATTLSSVQPGIPGHTARWEVFGGERYGTQLKAAYDSPVGMLTAGVWFEQDNYSAVRPQYNLFQGSVNGPFLFDQVLFLNYDQTYETTAMNAFIQDDLSLLGDRLKLSFGAKMLHLDRSAEGYLYTPAWYTRTVVKRDVTYKDSFLPQVGATYSLSTSTEIFANFAQNLAAPNSGVIANQAFDTGLKPERSNNYDLGVRYSAGAFGATASVFYNQYQDRIGSIPLTTEELRDRGLTGVTGATVYQNLGSIDSYGFETSAEWRTPIKGLKLTGSFAYLESKFQDDLRVSYSSWMDSTLYDFTSYYEVIGTGSSRVADAKISGKTQVNTPKFTANIDATYKLHNWTFTLGNEYRSSVYLNVFNTEELPSYILTRAVISWKGSKGTNLEPFGASLTVSNLFDRHVWYSTAGSATQFFGTAIADYGRNIILSVEAKF